MDPCTENNRELNVREEHQDEMEAEETSGFLDEENNSGISSHAAFDILCLVTV